MINELLISDGEVELVKMRMVAVKDYGSSGCIPIYEDDCMYKGEVSCISGSAGSICGGYYGHAGEHVVRCQEKAKQE
jgi:hypothetical protein